MRKALALAAIALMALVPICTQALEDIVLPTDGSFYDGPVITGRLDAETNTVPTAYTPRRIGDILIGGAGAGTNAVWVSKGKTTNDWVQAGIANDMPTIVAAIGSATGTLATAVSTAMAAQSDTNAVTVATGYTPRRKGDTLVGGAGSGTNGVWVSKGVTTNDWVQVEP